MGMAAHQRCKFGFSDTYAPRAVPDVLGGTTSTRLSVRCARYGWSYSMRRLSLAARLLVASTIERNNGDP
jgi:hypothetical protein